MTLINSLVKVFNKIGLLKYLNLKATVNVNGKQLQIPILKGLGAQHMYLHLSDPWMEKLLEKLKPAYHDHFVDIGVNLGQTLIAVLGVFDKIKYVGFEPNSSCINYVKEIIKLNQLKDFDIIPVGISNQTEILKLNFFSDDDNDSSASILADFRPDQKIKNTTYVPVFGNEHLRSFLPGQGKVLVKIDVEGAELEVLQGLSAWVTEIEPVIIVEILPAYSSDNTYRVKRQEKLQQLIASWDYLLFRITKGGSITLTQIDEIGIHGSIEDSDYLLCPTKNKESILKLF
jgi:FkbM family methyltransferase